MIPAEAISILIWMCFRFKADIIKTVREQPRYLNHECSDSIFSNAIPFRGNLLYANSRRTDAENQGHTPFSPALLEDDTLIFLKTMRYPMPKTAPVAMPE